MIKMQSLIYDKSLPGKPGVTLPKLDVPESKLPTDLLRKKKAILPELNEPELVRHFTNLSRLNFSVDTHFYPLGSCTMKYHPKFTEKIAALPGFTDIHPLIPTLPQGNEMAQGCLEVLFDFNEKLCEISGMDQVIPQPLAGSHGELAGIMLIAAYHKAKGNKKKYVIVPDSSHGTNPASAAMVGYEIITVPSDKNGEMDFEQFKAALNNEVAAVMLTNPNTLGLFETRVKEFADLAHSMDALMYYDGANLNAIMGKARPGDMGFDVVHINVHKTFATPHGGGGPGAGPIGVKTALVPYLPTPVVTKKDDGTYYLNKNIPQSIGKITPFYGNFGVLLKGYAYVLMMGKEGLIDVTEKAVLNANYILARLKNYFHLPYDRTCMHECVFSAKKQKDENGVIALDVAKFLIDEGFHPPSVYFPLVVKEAMMIEPTETEDKEILDEFIEAMIKAAKLTKTNPEILKNAPTTTPVSRPDETKAARQINVKWSQK